MSLRFFILASIACVAFSLACSPAMAEELVSQPSKTTVEKAEKAVTAMPTTTHRARLTTRERWRGAPYLRGSADELLRGQALDVALPPANSAFQGGAELQSGLFVAETDGVRKEALDKALPPANPAIVGGAIGGLGF
jgi:hypothetical protein